MIRLEVILWVLRLQRLSLSQSGVLSYPVFPEAGSCLASSHLPHSTRQGSDQGQPWLRWCTKPRLWMLHSVCFLFSGTFTGYFSSDVNLSTTLTLKLRGHPLRFIVYIECSVLCHADHLVASEAASPSIEEEVRQCAFSFTAQRIL